MPRPKALIPKYSRHGSSDRAVVYIDRKAIYLGKYGSPASKKKYAEVIAARTAAVDQVAVESGAARPEFSVNEICLAFVTKVLPKYKNAEGEPSAEQDCFKGVIRILRELLGESPANTFGPLKLRAARDVMITKGWCRTFINKQMARVRFIFRMAASWEMVLGATYQNLKTMEPLRYGDTEAPESVKRRAVPLENIAAAKKHLRQRNCDLIDLLLLTAARPSEILSITTQMIDRRGDVWSAELVAHKTRRHGHERTLNFGKRAQVILLKYLQPLTPAAKLFTVQRKTFGTAVKDACIKAGVPPFTPHWLRHTAVTTIADEVDLESAQRVAGHSKAAMTEAYSRAAQKKARAAVKLIG
jgi:integrase